MNNDFSDEPKVQTAGVLPIRRPAQNLPALRSGDPALCVMTDFTAKLAITVPPERQIDAALADMVRSGVRALLVVQLDSVIGLVTSYDIEGTRSVRFSAPPHLRRREDIRVSDIMTPWKDLNTLDWHTVETARIADLLEIFDGIGVMHLLVVENDACGAEVPPQLAAGAPQRSNRSGEKH